MKNQARKTHSNRLSRRFHGSSIRKSLRAGDYNFRDAPLISSSIFTLRSGHNLKCCIRASKLDPKVKKKPTIRILCITTKRHHKTGNEVYLNLVRNKRGEYRVARKFLVRDLLIVKGFIPATTTGSPSAKFEMTFKNKTRLQLVCDTAKHKDFFLGCLFMAVKENFLTPPKTTDLDVDAIKLNLQSYQEGIKLQQNPGNRRMPGRHSVVEDDIVDEESHLDDVLISREEEGLLGAVLNAYSMSVTDGSAIVDILQKKLEENQEQSIDRILALEPSWKKVLNDLRETREELIKTKGALDGYCEELHKLREEGGLGRIQSENNLMSIQSKNLSCLGNEMDDFIHKLEITKETAELLIRCDFNSEKQVKKLNKEVNRLVGIVDIIFEEDSMNSMKAVAEQKHKAENLLKKLGHRFVEFLEKCFMTYSSDFSHKRMERTVRGDLMETHTALYQDMKKYDLLMKIVHRFVGEDSVRALILAYCETANPLYQFEFDMFFFRTRKLIQENERSMKRYMFLLGDEKIVPIDEPVLGNFDFDVGLSLQKMKPVKPSSSEEVISLEDIGNLSLIKGFEEVDMDMVVDEAFRKAIDEMCLIINTEYNFCTTFFLDRTLSNKSDTSTLQLDEIMNRIIYKHMIEGFNELTNWIAKKCDLFYGISILHVIEDKRRTERNHFLKLALEQILDSVKEKLFVKFVHKQEESIMKYKPKIKKTTVVPFVAKLGAFYQKLAIILRKYRSSDLYQQHVNEMNLTLMAKVTERIEVLKGSSKKHAACFGMKNYFVFMHEFKKHVKEDDDDDNLSETILQTARIKYNEYRGKYMMKLLTYNPNFAKFFKFFGEVDTTLRTKDLNEIPQVFSVSKMSKVIQIFNKPNFNKRKKALEMCQFRMNKHVGKLNLDRSTFKFIISTDKNDLNFFRMTWEHFCQFFVTTLTKNHTTIRNCFTGFSDLNDFPEMVQNELDKITEEKQDTFKYM